MSVLEAQRRVSKKAFFSLARLGEQITYNGQEVVAIVEIGASLSRPDWNVPATAVEHASLTDIAYFSICDDIEDGGIPEPQEGDTIIYNGTEYSVAQLVMHDVTGALWLVFAVKNTKAFGLR